VLVLVLVLHGSSGPGSDSKSHRDSYERDYLMAAWNSRP